MHSLPNESADGAQEAVVRAVDFRTRQDGEERQVTGAWSAIREGRVIAKGAKRHLLEFYREDIQEGTVVLRKTGEA